jgi:hypothetical protein
VRPPGARLGKGRGTVKQYPTRPVVGRVTITSATPPSMGSSDTHQMTVRVESPIVPVPGTINQNLILDDRTVTYQSSNESVATVNSSGLVSGVGVGTVTITATSEGVATSTEYTLVSPDAAVDSVTVTPASMVLIEGEEAVFLATIRDSVGNILVGRIVTWSSTDEDVLTVGADSGDEEHAVTVMAGGAGSASVVATCETIEGASTVTVEVPASTYHIANLPRTRYQPAFSWPSGTKYTVTGSGSSSNFQTLLNNAVRGDIILIPAGVTLTGPFTIKDKPGTDWIYICAETLDLATFPKAEGVRVTTDDVASMPTLRVTTAGASAVIVTEGSFSNFYRLVGINFDITPGMASTSRLLQLGPANPTSLTELPNDIVVDRCLFQSGRNTDMVRGILAHVHNLFVTSSGFYEICHRSQDCQCLWGGYALSNWHVDNCYMETATEPIMLGGSPVANPSIEFTDITVRRSHFKHQMWQKFGDPTYNGRNYVIKNLFELKGGTRVLFEDNVLENYWSEDQDGSWNIKPMTASTGSQYLRDIVIRYNRYINVTTVGVISQTGPITAERIVLAHNYAQDLVSGSSNYAIKPFKGDDIQLYHNTFVHRLGFTKLGTAQLGSAGETPRIVALNNIGPKGTYGWKGNSLAEGTASLNGVSGTTSDFRKNIVYGGSAGAYPTANAISPQPSLAGIGFEDHAAGDCSLSSGSAYKNAGTDGTDIGADVVSVLARTAGCISGNWS